MPIEFNNPQSRNESILQNMLGAANELGLPESRIEALLMALLEQQKRLFNLPEEAGTYVLKVTVVDDVPTYEWSTIEAGG